MKKEYKFTMVGIIALVVGLFIGAQFTTTASVSGAETTGSELVRLQSIVNVCYKGVHSGWQEECQETHNVVTRIGKNHTRDILGGIVNATSDGVVGGINGTWRYLQLSTGTTDPNQNDNVCEITVVTAGGLAITDGPNASVSKFNEGNFSVVKTFTATATQAGIAKVCLFNQTVGGRLQASAEFPSTVNMEPNDQLTVNYSIAIT